MQVPLTFQVQIHPDVHEPPPAIPMCVSSMRDGIYWKGYAYVDAARFSVVDIVMVKWRAGNVEKNRYNISHHVSTGFRH